MTTDGRIALVLGAGGGIGGELARELRDRGWIVRGMGRSVRAGQRDGIDWIAGDALDPRAVAAAARGCAVIAHAVNPPGYRRWNEWVLPMLDNTLAAAAAERATVLLPGTVYNYGPDVPVLAAEDAPQNPVGRKGAIRVEMEARLRAFAHAGKGRALVVRAGDYFGPRLGGSWFGQAMLRPGRPVRRIRFPGLPGVGHQWGYLPDVARTMALLLDRIDRLEPFARFHMGGHWDPDGRAMVDAIRRVVTRHGGPEPRVGALPWWAITLLSPFDESMREMREVRRFWHEPLRLDNSRLLDVLGFEPHTPLDEAVETTLLGLGCLGEAPSGLAAA
jgi:nucleoside-diphosphate-sugar epimerase